MEDDKKKNNSRIVSFDAALRDRAEGNGEDDGYVRKVKKHKILSRLGISLLFLVVIGVMVYLLVIRRTESYTSIGVEWEQQILTSADMRYVDFAGGILQYGTQGANYYTAENKTTWAASYSMNNPEAICSSGYAVIFDRGAKSAVILSKDTGLTGKMTAPAMITKATVSDYGVAALLLEEELSNTIYFYNNTGATLDINIHTLVNQSGYPLDIAFSPDGQMMVASFVYIDSGITQDQIVFYNFDEKRSTTGVVGAFRKYDDTLFADVAFLNNDRAIAFGDGKIVLYNLKNKTAPEEMKEIDFDEKITGAAYSSSGFAVCCAGGEKPGEHRLFCYGINGDTLFERTTDFDAKSMLRTKNGLYLIGDSAVSFINNKGKTFFTGSLECEIIKLNNPDKDNELLFITNSRAVFLKLFRG